MGYGTGAIMAVPSGDQRDLAFARALSAADPRRRPAGGEPDLDR
jgi:leucyl-tRNA synthetase